MDQHEIRHARRYLKPELGNFLEQPREPALVVSARCLDMRGISDRGNSGRHGGAIYVEGGAYAVHRAHDMRGGVQPPEAKSREPVNLGERTTHDDVLRSCHELDTGLVVVPSDVLRVGGVEHKQNVGRQSAVQALYLIERRVGTGWIVRIGKKYDPGALAHEREDRIHISGIVGLRCRHRRCPRTERGYGIDQKAVGGVDGFVAVPEIGVSDQIQEIIRSGPAHNAVGIKPEGATYGFSQRRGRPVGIILQAIRHFTVRCYGVRTRPQRCLVGRKLEHLGNTWGRALPRHIGIDRAHAWRRLLALQERHFRLRKVRHRADAGHRAAYSGWHGYLRGSRSALTRPRPPISSLPNRCCGPAVPKRAVLLPRKRLPARRPLPQESPAPARRACSNPQRARSTFLLPSPWRRVRRGTARRQAWRQDGLAARRRATAQ